MGYGALYLAATLVAGYVFVYQYPATKYKHTRTEGWNTYLHAGAWGFLFSIFSTIITCLVFGLDDGEKPGLTAASIVFLTPTLAFLTGRSMRVRYYGFPDIITTVLNHKHCPKWLHSKSLPWVTQFNEGVPEKQRKRILDIVMHHPLEKLVILSASNPPKPVFISMKSRKVYIGLITNSGIEHGKLDYISIIPLISGYRKEDDFRFVETVQYAEMYKAIDRSRLGEFTAALPVEEIESAKFFDYAVYEHFKSLDGQKESCENGSHI